MVNYKISQAELVVFQELAERISEDLKTKDKVAAKEEDIIKAIFEEIEKEYKEDLEEELEEIEENPNKIRFNGISWSISHGSKAEQQLKAEKDFNNRLQYTKENFDVIHIYGRVAKFFKNTGYSLKPGRDNDGNRIYLFYDSKRVYVLKDG